MLQSGNLQIQNSNLGPGNLSSNSGSLSSGGRGLTGPTTYISVENDPIFSSSPAATITNEDIERWNQEIDLSSYITSDELAQELSSYVSNPELEEALSSYATISYVNSYVSYVLSDLDIDIDLSSYITSDELAQELSSYVSDTELAQILSSYVTNEYLSSCGYVTLNDIPSIDLSSYVSDSELAEILISYITSDELSSMGYITSADIPSGLVIDENLIPKQTNTYTLGTGSYFYKNTYTYNTYFRNRISISAWEDDILPIYNLILKLNNSSFVFSEFAFQPSQQNLDLGNYQIPWKSTYTYSLYLNGTNIEDRLSSYVTNEYLSNCGYVTDTQLQSQLQEASYITAADIPNIDLSSYISDSELAEILSSYATKNYTYTNYVSYTYLGDLNEIIDYIIGGEDPSSPENLYATRQELDTLLLTYATKNYVDNAILNAEIGGGSGVTIDLTYYLRKDELPSYLSSYVTKNELNQALASYVTENELSSCGYATESYVMDKINSIPSGGGGDTYISYNTYNTSIWQGSLSQYQNLSDHTTYQLYLIAQE